MATRGPEGAPPQETLDDRALGRALLARQHLLRRAPLAPAAAVEHLVGLQAQAVLPPYVGLWSRLDGFAPEALGALLESRALVRLTLMRGTIHLVTGRDAWALRPVVQPAIVRGHRGAWGKRVGDVAPERIADAVHALLADAPLGGRELGRRLVEAGVGTDVEAMADAATAYATLVQVTPRGVWGASAAPAYRPLATWAPDARADAATPDEVVLRYLAAFGPASVRDAQAWAGITGLAATFARLRDRLVTFRDARGRELFDLPDAPRPGGDVAAPARFLGEFDNVFLAHADRARIWPEGFRWGHVVHGRSLGMVLVDGLVRAGWWAERPARGAGAVVVRPFGPLTRAERADVLAEGRRLAALLDPGARDADVRFERV
ncbi:winged helix DNA-binding domain-containing protein [Roseisolibacter sp. H3M3-2]|uniref:winged helix DNA-binding domain-containing protein n=1 Tax=Roseisolibacter sp. H3M3-2 TaxID=3031323 RepID=UPI0023D9BA1C|nr:winged helix DNA-binding domain-containing protein [Roseisolibacter sp. H3M3-2]MDF1502232.1 winged helix DNA-binding domain-containing protein [Roseisolibacter sp. H3M3-2]